MCEGDLVVCACFSPAPWHRRHRYNPDPSWTYRLQELLRDRIAEMSFKDDRDHDPIVRQKDEVEPLDIYIRGPYGSTFDDCFSAA